MDILDELKSDVNLKFESDDNKDFFDNVSPDILHNDEIMKKCLKATLSVDIECDKCKMK